MNASLWRFAALTSSIPLVVACGGGTFDIGPLGASDGGDASQDHGALPPETDSGLGPGPDGSPEGGPDGGAGDSGQSTTDGSGGCESGSCETCGAKGQACCSAGTSCAASLDCVGGLPSNCQSIVIPQCTCEVFSQQMQLKAGQQLRSCDGNIVLKLQTDNDLAVYRESGNVLLWDAKTAGTGAVVATLQDDGNLVLYDSGGIAIWSSATAPAGCGTFAQVQDDGNFVIYNAGGTAIWSNGGPP
jgi:hypothetical protein